MESLGSLNRRLWSWGQQSEAGLGWLIFLLPFPPPHQDFYSCYKAGVVHSPSVSQGLTLCFFALHNNSVLCPPHVFFFALLRLLWFCLWITTLPTILWRSTNMWNWPNFLALTCFYSSWDKKDWKPDRKSECLSFLAECLPIERGWLLLFSFSPSLPPSLTPSLSFSERVKGPTSKGFFSPHFRVVFIPLKRNCCWVWRRFHCTSASVSFFLFPLERSLNLSVCVKCDFGYFVTHKTKDKLTLLTGRCLHLRTALILPL